MKIVQLMTNVNVRAGTGKAEKFFTVEGNGLGKVEKLTAYNHPDLGPGVMIETILGNRAGRVSFVAVTNIEEVIFSKEEVASQKAKK
jgi:hypothetical protein